MPVYPFRDEATGRVQYRIYEDKELQPLLDAVNEEKAKEDEAAA